MKSVTALVLVAALVSLGATVWSPSASQDAGSVHWRKLLEQDVSMYAAERSPGQGGPGASAIGFRVSDAVQGGALVVGLDRPALGVFVGLNTPDEHVNEPYRDLRVEFTLADGTTRTVAPAGGGGISMLFQSPDDVPLTSLRKVALYVDDSAEWTRSSR